VRLVLARVVRRRRRRGPLYRLLRRHLPGRPRRDELRRLPGGAVLGHHGSRRVEFVRELRERLVLGGCRWGVLQLRAWLLRERDGGDRVQQLRRGQEPGRRALDELRVVRSGHLPAAHGRAAVPALRGGLLLLAHGLDRVRRVQVQHGPVLGAGRVRVHFV
jgi:hypothetical protein